MVTPSIGGPALSDDDGDVSRGANGVGSAHEAATDVVSDWNLVTNELEFSPAVRPVFRYGDDEPVNSIDWWSERVHPDDRDTVLRGIEASLAGRGHFWSAEYRFRRGDGSYAHVFDRGFISRDVGGKAVRMLGSMFDVTYREAAQAALRESERRFRALIENASDAIAIIGGDGKFNFASESYIHVLGFSPAELQGRDVLELVHPEELAAASRALAEIMRAPDATVHITLRCRHKDGSWRLLDARARNLLHDPSIEGIVSASRDITQERALENELAQAQKMEAMGQLAGGVAHDFNNLLTVISTNVELLGSALPSQSPLHGNLAEVRRAAAQAAGLTRQLLNFTHRRSEDTQIVNLNEVVTDSEALLRRVIGDQSDLRVTTSIKPPLVKIDRAQLDQVLTNLVFNARDALADGGVVEVATELNTVQAGERQAAAAVPPGEYSVLIVRDTGAGMSPETRARAFDPFYTTKEIGKGTGLGLAMVYRIVKQARGFIDVDTERGVGTTFRIYLPRVASAAMPTPVDGVPAVRPAGATETILLVEDEDMVRKVVRRTLVAQGYNVIEAANGREALALALPDPTRISLVLTDVMMPEMGGPELARELWERWPNLKIMFLSGYAPDTMFAESALPLGAVLLEKPFAIDTLVMRVRDVLDSDRAGTRA